MLTNDKTITTKEYWGKVYAGENLNAKVDSSNTVRPKNTFDRFGWVAQHAEGPGVLGIASGHGHVEKRIKAKHPDWEVIASDQAKEARKVANYEPYIIIDAYNILTPRQKFDTVICCQALEYMEDPDKFLIEAKRVGKKFLCTVPLGEMKSWSQLRIYTEENFKAFLSKHGTIEHFEIHESLMMGKIKF